MNAITTPELREQHQYDLPQKSQNEKFPKDVTFNQPTDIKLQLNTENYPTDTPGDSFYLNDNGANTTFNDLDNDQIDMAHPNKESMYSAQTIKDFIRTARASTQQNSFIGYGSIPDLIKK